MTASDDQQDRERTGLEIAVVGMAGKFPGAHSLAQFWENIANGVDSIGQFTDEELLESGVDPVLLSEPNYVKAKGFIEDVEYFDAAFFHYSEREAEITDPQIRILQECAWEALEGAGYVPQTYEGRIGLFAGAATNFKWMELSPLGKGAQGAAFAEAATLSYKDALSTLTAYKLGLTGPCVTLYTACSTSLLAIHLASRALITGECELALAGGVTIAYPKKAGYLHEQGMTASADGHTRPFAADAGGAVFGDGAGVVLLKRLEDALQDGDDILAVIKGSAANNDGARKVGYTAPSVEGEYEAIATALSLAEVDAETISYVETHGTATPLGDTIEFEALKQAFVTTKKSYCAIGSVKSNVGHLDTASGVTGFIKTVLALQHRQIPPSLHFDHPNPKIGFVDSPFYVNTELVEWETDSIRRAGVSSFGYGGTNVHVVLEEAPGRVSVASKRASSILTLAAHTPSALAKMAGNLADSLRAEPDLALADVAYTLQTGRQHFAYRRAVVCSNREEALTGLEQIAWEMPGSFQAASDQSQRVLLRLGARGVSGPDILKALYQREPLVREEMDRCLRLVEVIFGTQVRRAVNSSVGESTADPASVRFCRDFTLEYVLAGTLLRLGIEPLAIAAQGLSRYTAACLAQVLSVEDALRWGSLSLPLAIDPANQVLQQRFVKQVRHTQLHKPVFPLLLEGTGTGVVEEAAQDAEFWLHIASQGTEREVVPAWTEPGPRASLIVQIGAGEDGLGAATSLEASSLVELLVENREPADVATHFLDVLARLWSQGCNFNWSRLSPDEHRLRLHLPTYPFEKQRFWLDPPERTPHKNSSQMVKRADLADWFYVPAWQARRASGRPIPPSTWIVFQDQALIGEQLAERLRVQGHEVVFVRPGRAFANPSTDEYRICVTQPDDYKRLWAEISQAHTLPLRVLHLWTFGKDESDEQLFDLGFYALLYLMKGMEQPGARQALEITLLTDQLYKVAVSDQIVPAKMSLLAPLKVIPQEYTHLRCRCIDCEFAEFGVEQAITALLGEITLEITDTEIARRDEGRYVQTYQALPEERLRPALALSSSTAVPPLRERGVYLITGGLGGIGLKLAGYLARALQARLVLVSRTGLPPRDEWQNWLEAHDQDEKTRFRIQQVQALEASGSPVFVAAADAADEEQMRQVFQQTEAIFGKINGVIHAAGILRVQSAQCPIATIRRDECEEQLRPKVSGLQVLQRLLATYEMDFCLLVSSLSPILGGLGFVAYAAANLYMDAFVQAHSSDPGSKWIGVNWGDWQYEGPKFQKRMARTAIDALEMTTEEAIKTFQCILSLESTRQIVVSSGDLFARIEQWIQLKPIREKSVSPPAAARVPQIREQVSSQEHFEQMIVAIWQEFYRVQAVDRATNFFELGATSLDVIQMHTKLVDQLQRHIPIEYMFEHPTITQLAEALSRSAMPQERVLAPRRSASRGVAGDDIAVIGMAGRFPGADSVDEFWQNLVHGVESIRFFTESELEEAGVRKEELRDPNYRRARGYLAGTEYFDASFFDYTPRDALLMDPQLRLFHECAWSAIESSGYNISTYQGRVGVFGGASPNLYWQVLSLLAEGDEPADLFLASLLNDKDSLSTQISYKFDLNGPSVNVFSGCSTSLVAIDYACAALLSGECDIALAGGITAGQPDKAGYIYQENMLFSEDGHCRTFDKAASGAVFGDGVGVVVLKPLSQALADGDTIRAVIKGSAINNDGHRKIGYTAPSVDGQAEVINAALVKAGVTPESIGYIETHGTATRLGDVIEVAALKKVFGNDTRAALPIGSVKTNIGHVNAAAGVASFIKTVLCLEKRQLPASLHYETPNPQIDFASSPFYVNATLQEWRSERYPLRAGVSSFGIGGTNAHVILEEPPRVPLSESGREWKLLLLSAKSQAALERMTDNLAEYFQANPSAHLADAAYTLQVGRQAFDYRRTLLCREPQEASDLLRARDPQVRTFPVPGKKSTVVFLFPGHGAQRINMARDLYEKEALFRAEMDACLALLAPLQDTNLKALLYPPAGDTHAEAQAERDMQRGQYSQPLIFCVEYALARLLMSWGIQPSALMGYSCGEYVAACLAGVFSLRDALQLVSERGRLMSELPEGAMVSVPLVEEQTITLINDFKAFSRPTIAVEPVELVIVIDNGSSCIVASSPETIADFERFLHSKQLLSVRVASEVAAPLLQREHATSQFAEYINHITLNAPGIPFISGITGTWITDEQAQDRNYWVRHMKETAHFARGIEKLTKNVDAHFLEVGPGRDLSISIQRFLEHQAHRVQPTLGLQGQQAESQSLFECLATLWGQGIPVDWEAFSAQEVRHRIPLPTYSFERTSYKRQGNLFDLMQASGRQKARPGEDISKSPDPAQWFYAPRWRSTVLPHSEPGMEQWTWLIFGDEAQFASGLAQELRESDQRVISVKPGPVFAQLETDIYQLNPGERAQYAQLLGELRQRELFPEKILHCTSLTDRAQPEPELDVALTEGFYSLLFLLQALTEQPIIDTVDIRVITSGTQNVIGDERLIPAHACLIGPGIVAAQELPYVRCSTIDVVAPPAKGPINQRLRRQLLAECLAEPGEPLVAYRGDYRWTCDYQPLTLERPAPGAWCFRPAGTYLITGAFGGIGKIIARYLAETHQAKLILVSRQPVPEHWLDPGSQAESATRLRFVQELEASGAEVLVLSANCVDLSGMAAVIAAAEQRFGELNGVIHAAGLVGDETFKMLRDLEVSDCEKQFQAKVRGVLVLEELLREKHLDFCLLMSSISVVLGGLAYGAYAAANQFLDTFVHQQAHLTSLPWYVVDWSDWKYWDSAEKQGSVGQSVHKLSMEPTEGIDALERVLAYRERHLVHSPGSLDLRIKQWVRPQVTQSEDGLDQAQRHPRPDLLNAYVAPQTRIEKVLAEIWAATFKLEKVGIQDNFFELGGDSLKGVTVVSRIHKDLHVEFPVAELFQTSTIAGLASFVQNAQNSEFYSINVSPVKEYYRLSSAQKRLYILHQLHPDATTYNDSMAYVLHGELDLTWFEKVFQQIIARHESFRTSFLLSDGEPVQKIHPSVKFKLFYREVTFEQARDLVEHFITPFDLRQAPLLRVALLKVGVDRHILVLDIHHIITDGVSYDCLVRDFITLYQGGASSPLRLQYKDYAEWQYSEQARSLVAQQEAYWLKKFAGRIPRLSLLTDYPRPDVPDFSGARVAFELGEACTEQVKRVAQAHSSTVYTYLLSVFNILLSKYADTEDLVVGSPVAGRSHPDLQGIIGMFVNMLPMRTTPAAERQFNDYLLEVQRAVFEAFDNDKYQYDELVIKLGLHGNIHENPLFDVVFVLQNMNTEQLYVGKLQIEQYDFVPNRAAFDLVLSAVEVNGNFKLTLEYATALFQRKTIARMAEHYLAILQEVLEKPEIKLKEIAISHEMRTLEDDVLRIGSEDFAF